MRNKKTIFAIILIALLLGVAYTYNFFYSKTHIFTITPSKLFMNCEKNVKVDDREVVKVLIISGGGVKGLIPIAYLRYIEEKTHQPIRNLFDLYIGTSTGSIIVSLLNTVDEKGVGISANQLWDDYISLSSTIMHASGWRKLFTLGGLLGSKFSTQNLYQVFSNQKKLNQAFYTLKNKVLVSNFNLDTLKVNFLSNDPCQPRAHASIAQILTSTSAAPFYFSPVTFNISGKEQTFSDGGIITNQPIFKGLNEIKQQFPNAKKIILVFLGTTPIYLNQLTKDSKATHFWGLVDWAPTFHGLLFDSQSYEVDEGVKDILNYNSSYKIKFYHFKVNQPISSFDASKQYVQYIEKNAQQSIDANRDTLNQLIQDLLK